MSNEPKQMSLSQCAKFDHENKLREKVTGWGIISKERHEKKISRSFRIRNKTK